MNTGSNFLENFKRNFGKCVITQFVTPCHRFVSNHCLKKYAIRDSAAMLSTKRSAGIALRGEYETGDKACKQGNPPGVETQDRHHRKSRTRVSLVTIKKLLLCQKLYI